MGQYIGVYAKKDDQLCFEKPIFTEEDTELNNKLRSAKSEFDELVKTKLLAEEILKGMSFTENEIKALKCNYVQDNADGEIEYSESSGDKLPEDFYAIGVKCNGFHCFVYDPKYLKYENWAKYEDVEGGIIKMMKILHERVKVAQGTSDYLLYDFENVNMLYGILKTIKEIYNPDEVAIIIAP